MLDRFRDSVKLKGKSRSKKAEAISFINDIVIAVLAGILIVLMFILQASLVSHLSYRLMIAITYILPLVLLVCLFLTLITPMDVTVDLSFAAHSLYAFCLTISEIDFVNLFADKLVKLNHQKGICSFAESTGALYVFYVYGVGRNSCLILLFI
ncbi:hypothetical protein [Bifidobacterium sp. H6bp9]|uniref:hypothetical protein n=1 Tax=Bifidobacterium sp. H6bp9 TaxID=3051961 RepID=UPI0028BED82E|nr:hypothetical protein [Bifidobacterium sp. H6bp9]MDT7511122.1 hypothetical protein [Bifidobacterium sp. H6bp9]